MSGMTFKLLSSLMAISLLVGTASVAAPQRPVTPVPTPAEASAILRNRPDFVKQLQARLKAMGMTPQEIRDRLRAEGYPDNLLDAYLPGAVGADSTAIPSDDVFGALRALNVPDLPGVDSLRNAATRVRTARAQTDSAFLDTLSAFVRDESSREAMRRFIRERNSRYPQVDSGYTVFGLSLFRGESSQFDPNTAGSVDANYRIGPGDHIVLFLTGDVELSFEKDVTREGFIVIPKVGQISVAGLTKAQLEDLLYTRLRQAFSGIRRGADATTHFSVNISRVGTNQVVVTGDVVRPNSYQISRAGTLLSALYAAQGPTETGSLRRVELHRGGQLVATLDLYDYLLRGDGKNDVRLENGDVVFVPPRGAQVRIAGAVLRPATYEIKPNETLGALIQMAGNFTALADKRTVQIDRIGPPDQDGGRAVTNGAERYLVAVPPEAFASPNGPNEPLRNGDIIRVFDIPRRLVGRVSVDGSVWVPGSIGLDPGMRLSGALRRAGGLKPDSYLGDIQIARLQPDSTRVLLHTAGLDTTGRVKEDFALVDGDQILIFSRTEFRPDRYVTISGAVKATRKLPFRDGMTLRDLVLLAGGLAEGALLTEAEIARLPDTRSGGSTANLIRTPLDSTYLFERDGNGRYLGPPGVPAPTARAADFPLKAYDAVTIFFQPDWERERLVSLLGEVRFPNRYALKTKGEKISDLIQRAGGLTPAAYANGVSFIRHKDGVGRIGLDLPAVLRDPRHTDNIILVDGDSIFIPEFSAVVLVSGEVNSPVAVPYARGKNIDYYVRSAGGETAVAEEGKAYVRQPNGKVESRNRYLHLFTSVPYPEPGSEVVVPKKDTTAKHDYVAAVGIIAQVIGSLVALVAIARR